MFKSLMISLAIGLFAIPLSAETSSKLEKDPAAKIEYKVKDGDTLGSIALRFEVAVSDMRSWNKLESNKISAGDRLVLKRGIPVEKISVLKPKVIKQRRRTKSRRYKVRRGDTFESIARKHKTSIQKVRKMNPRVNPRRLQIGQRIKLSGSSTYYSVPTVKLPTKIPANKSVSWGKANYGRLYNGVTMKSTPGLAIRNPARAYGTRHTIRMLEAAAADVVARWPDTQDLHVGDLSHPNGGHMGSHKSHQSGRDADISYYHRGNVKLNRFVGMTPETFDAVKNWHLFKTLIDTQQVEYIFVDYRLQKVLYEYAISIGYRSTELAGIIQYPRRGGAGIIRDAKGHDNHFHIRFKCYNDKYCQ